MSTRDKILMVVHQEHSDPGRIGAMLSARGYDLDIRCPACGSDLPDDGLERWAGIVVFGGPMSANDDHLPFVRQELDWLAGVAASDRPYLGICLGAQMMARVLGGQVSPRSDDRHEIGYVEIKATTAGKDYFPDTLGVYQWHGEGFTLPVGTELLAQGDYFPNQAVRFRPKSYGLQYHPEVTGSMMRRWQVRAAHKLSKPGAQQPEAQRADWARFDPDLARWTERFLDRWLSP